jgi:hypothetical protein
LYFRYGLKASIAAHATFNGLLVAVAIISVIGPAHNYTVDGATLRLPAQWKQTTIPTSLSEYHLGLTGPSGSAILVTDSTVSPGTVFNPKAIVSAAQQHLLPVPVGTSVDSSRIVTYPSGPAVIMTLTADGHAGYLAIMVEHDRAWIFVLATAGSPKASSDFDHMMQTLRLP